jgi:hypothetical protein
MSATRYTFRAYGVSGKKSGKCPHCGKRATRSERFEQTLNPFNRAADGFPKSEAHIIRECEIKRDAWLTLPTYHANCEYEMKSARKDSK